MGAGIASVSIDKGITTVLLDMHDEGLSRGMNQIYSHYDKLAKKKRITLLQQSNAIARLKPTTNYEDVKNSDVVIEAVFEDLSLKHKVIQQVSD